MSTLFSERPVWAERPSLPARVTKSVTLVAIALVIVFPLYIVILTSLSPASAVNDAGGLVLILGVSFAAYADLFSGGVVTRAVLVSLGITTVGTLVSLVATILAAYGLSRPGSLWHRPLLFAVLLTFLFAPG